MLGGIVRCIILSVFSAWQPVKTITTTKKNLLYNVSLWGSEAVGLVHRFGYSRQDSWASNRLG
jgi:hypothetical protein